MHKCVINISTKRNDDNNDAHQLWERNLETVVCAMGNEEAKEKFSEIQGFWCLRKPIFFRLAIFHSYIFSVSVRSFTVWQRTKSLLKILSGYIRRIFRDDFTFMYEYQPHIADERGCFLFECECVPFLLPSVIRNSYHACRWNVEIFEQPLASFFPPRRRWAKECRGEKKSPESEAKRSATTNATEIVYFPPIRERF